MEVVTTRDANTLLPIIQAHIAIVHSDEWRAYRRVSTLPYVFHIKQ